MNAFFETTNGFNFQTIDPLIESWGIRLTWLNCYTGAFTYQASCPGFSMIDEQTTLLTVTPHKKLLVLVSNYHDPELHNFITNSRDAHNQCD